MSGCECQKAALRLLAISRLINQAVGDALSGLLLVEAILQHMGWSIEKWSELYKDLPSKQLKVSSTLNPSRFSSMILACVISALQIRTDIETPSDSVIIMHKVTFIFILLFT